VATVTTSPRCIGVKLGDRLDPLQRFALAIGVKTRDLLCHPTPHRPRTGIGNHETQLAQTPCAPPLPHHPHPFGGLWHSTSSRNALQCNALRAERQGPRLQFASKTTSRLAKTDTAKLIDPPPDSRLKSGRRLTLPVSSRFLNRYGCLQCSERPKWKSTRPAISPASATAKQ